MTDKPKLRAPAIDQECSAPLQKRALKLANSVDEINKDWQQLLADKQQFSEQDPATFDPSEGRNIVERELRILQRDLSIREEVLQVAFAIQKEAGILAASQRKSIEGETTRIEEQLRGIGYEEIPPQAVSYHPALIARKRRLDQILTGGNQNELVTFTESEAKPHLRKLLESIKKRLLAGV
jgi:hypothetical protein